MQISYPKTKTKIGITIQGIYSFPQQWKITDQSNPNLFTYTAKISSLNIDGGKIYPRQLTSKQQRQQQQQSKKKPIKKQTKKQDPSQIQKLKQTLQKQQEQEKQKETLYNSLTQQQKIYFNHQDKYKSSLLKFTNNTIEKQIQNKQFCIWQERITKDQGQWLYLFKSTTATQQEQTKFKKSKPKTLNLADLNPLTIRTWVDLSSLNSTTQKQIQLRCKLSQVLPIGETNATVETPKPNLDNTYVKIKVFLSQPLLSSPDEYTSSNVINDPPQPSPIPPNIKCVNEMKDQMRLAIQSLAMEYSAMFSKELNAFQQQKSSLIFVNNRKNDHSKRKEQFLYDFNVSGKYKVLKERLKKVIVHLCQNKFIDKMQGAKSFTGITCSVRDQFYSEIYNFLVSSYADIMAEMIQQKKHILGQVFVLAEPNQQAKTQSYLQSYKAESLQNRIQRILNEHIAIGDLQYGTKIYKEAIAKQSSAIELKYQYSLYCIKSGINSINQVLNWNYIEEHLQHNKTNQNAKITYVLCMIASQEPTKLKKAWIILRELLQEEPGNILFMLYGYLLHSFLQNTDLTVLFYNKAERQLLRDLGRIKQFRQHREDPQSSQVPSLNSVASYSQQLTPEQKDDIWIKAIVSFLEFGLINVVSKIKQKIADQNNIVLKKFQIKTLYKNGEYEKCKEEAIQLFETCKDFDILETIFKSLGKLGDNDEKEKYLKLALRTVPKQKRSGILLNLGYFYLQTGKYGNCKACLTKYLEGNTSAGGLSWQILGISQLKNGNFDVSIECFRQSNLSDPFNKQVWGWLAEAYSKTQNFVMVNQCLNSYLAENQASSSNEKLKEVKQSIKEAKGFNFYDQTMKTKLLQRLESY